MTSQNQFVLDAITKTFPDAVIASAEFRDELTVEIGRDKIVEICAFLKTDPALSFDLLADLCGIDMATPEKRFGVVYNLYSLKTHHRIRLKVFVEESDPTLPTVTSVWGTANWHERETFDMFGIVFRGHPDLRRMYLPDEFEHHPLRKDFPLMGIPGSLQLPKK